ncbi:trophoblast glycoprotein-like [Ptychodera flava]|uniref:trophoblast glycoprotein-like n=1 Tax=Ptychodera flava TaxID=63121 RepID=UPI00396A91D6
MEVLKWPTYSRPEEKPISLLLSLLLSFICISSVIGDDHPVCPKTCSCSGTPTSGYDVKCVSVGFPEPNEGATQTFPEFTSTLAIVGNSDMGDLPENPFGNLPELKKLDLSNNSITSVEVKTFQGRHLPALEELILDHNDLTFEHSKMLNSLDKLRNLSLKEAIFNATSIGSLNHALNRSYLPNLRNMWLDSNDLVVIPTTLFLVNGTKKAGQHLELISLRNNSIGHISPGTFDPTNLVYLRILDLSNNGIRKFQKDELDDFDGFSNLTLQLYPNPFSCDCSLRYFHSWLSKTNVTVVDKNLLTCADGYPNAKMRVVEVEESALQCDHPPSVQHYVEPSYVVLGIILSFLIACLLGVVFLRRNQIKTTCSAIFRAARDSLESGPYGDHRGYTDISKSGRESPDPPEVHL